MKPEPSTYHFIGIGGAGMSVIASILSAAGHRVSGSDRTESKVLEDLRAQGVDAYPGHGTKNFPEDAIVVLSSAIREDNPELVLARERHQPAIHRSQALAEAAQGMRFVAVAGSHGKTTTSSMIAVTLLECGWDPSLAIGGPVLGVGGGGRLGRDVFVAEADESDGSFLNYSPDIAVVTNIEPDHLDHYGTKEAFEDAFYDFAARLTPGGTLICCAEDEGAAELARKVSAARLLDCVQTYGRPEHSFTQPTIEITSESLGATRAAAQLDGDAGTASLDLQVTGAHNVLNAVGAWAACVALGLSPQEASEGLSRFVGAGRRFELVGEVAGRRAYDDYAHHPAEVAAALKQARLAAGDGKVIVVFQPHLYSRTVTFKEGLAAALSLADEVVLADIYGSREDPIEGVTSALLVDSEAAEKLFHYPGDARSAALLGASLTEEGDVCVLMGAGDIFLSTPEVVHYWTERA